MFILYDSLIFSKVWIDVEKCTYTRNKKSRSTSSLTTEFSREIIEIAVQFTNQIYTVLHLHINRNGRVLIQKIYTREHTKRHLYITITILMCKNRKKNLQK